MVLLEEYDTPQEAYIVQGMLEANGIDASVSDNSFSSVFPAPDAGTGSVQLFVAEKDVEKARELLRLHHDD